MLNIIDVAKDQAGINLSVIPGLDGVIVGCTAGDNFVNPHGDEQYQGAKAANHLRGFYHIPEPGVFDPIKQADFFVANCRGYFGDGIPILDWEETDTTRADLAYEFLCQVRSLTGVSPWIYMSESVYHSADWAKVKAEFSLWIAQYRYSQEVEGWNPGWSMPSGIDWPTIAAYQYSSTTRLAGWDGHLDTSVYYGDRDSWARYVKAANPNHAPAPVPVNHPVPAPTPVTHIPTFTATVEKNDTFSSIAAQFKVPLRELEDFNPGIDYNNIFPGQVVIVPGHPPAPTGRPSPAKGVRVIWRVDPGENLTSIAAQTHTTVAAICETNHIADPNMIRIGQILNIY